MSYLDKPASRADVVSLMLGIPSIMLGVLICPLLPTYIAKFQAMFTSLGAQLPPLTIFVISAGPWFFPLMGLIAASLPIIAWIRDRSLVERLILPTISLGLVTLLVGMMLLGIVLPILELESAVRE